jgi:ubiquinone/menaquinone biosynthesis C-methylase UbiE
VSLTKKEIKELYRKRAKSYDLATRLYPLIGVRLDRYRRLAVEALSLRLDDTVVDLGCGTGANFSYLQQYIGDSGHIIGVDLSEEMLDQAQRRIASNGWQNVELIQADMAHYSFPSGVAAVLSTFAITLVPEYDMVICRGAAALHPGGHLAVLDIKKPDNWPAWLIRFAVLLNKPYGVSLDLAVRHPWESVGRYLRPVMFREFYFGAIYLSVGIAPID